MAFNFLKGEKLVALDQHFSLTFSFLQNYPLLRSCQVSSTRSLRNKSVDLANAFLHCNSSLCFSSSLDCQRISNLARISFLPHHDGSIKKTAWIFLFASRARSGNFELNKYLSFFLTFFIFTARWTSTKWKRQTRGRFL